MDQKGEVFLPKKLKKNPIYYHTPTLTLTYSYRSTLTHDPIFIWEKGCQPNLLWGSFFIQEIPLFLTMTDVQAVLQNDVKSAESSEAGITTTSNNTSATEETANTTTTTDTPAPAPTPTNEPGEPSKKFKNVITAVLKHRKDDMIHMKDHVAGKMGKKKTDKAEDNTANILVPMVYKGHDQWVRVLTISHCGCFLYSASSDDSVRVWKTSTGECIETIQVEGDWVDAIAPSEDGRLLYILASSILIWSTTPTYELQSAVEGQWSSLSLSVRSPHLFAGGENGVHIFNTVTLQCERELKIEMRGKQVMESPCGEFLFTGGESGLSVWNVGKWDVLAEDSDQCDAFAVSPCGEFVYVTRGFAEQSEDAEGKGCVFILCAHSLEQRKIIDCTKLPGRADMNISSLYLSPCGRLLYTVGNGVSVWNTRTLKYQGMLTNQQGCVCIALHQEVVFHAEKNILVSKAKEYKAIGKAATPGKKSSGCTIC